MGASPLAQVLRRLPVQKSASLMVGFGTADDAAVYEIHGDKAVVATLDFFPPVVDDPFTFGQIAASNALSDIYAMGGTPAFALNIVCFPDTLGLGVLERILKGGLSKLKEAGVVLAGGHSIVDNEVKYGLSVTGFVDRDKVIRNSTARPGDVLILTKPIGTGIVTTALKRGILSTTAASEAIKSMKALNKAASLSMTGVKVNACTDITGYGLIGHAMEMAKGSGVNIVIRAGDVPVFKAAMRLVGNKAARPGGLERNRASFGKDVRVSGVSGPMELFGYDPQTSGGLLISAPKASCARLVKRLVAQGAGCAIIGRVESRTRGRQLKLE
ncbi:MAG: selenide, water dikinase SelD [Deltaproteobacteria bacterium]|nr:selenide, water dikinase SelD [Deltaproteobacteria bacterium]